MLNLLPPDSPLAKETEKSLGSLKPRVEEAQKRETAEMLDKLKGVGNSVLGKWYFSDAFHLFMFAFLSSGRFGLSTDNFKFVPNGQGGYSMNFTQ